MKRRSTAALAAFSSLLMTGCAVGTVGQAERAYDGAHQDAARLMDQSRAPLPAASVSTVQVVDEVFTTSVARRAENGDPLPRKWETPGVTIVRASPMKLHEIGTAITDATGIPVSFSADIEGIVTRQVQAAPAGNEGAGGTQQVTAIGGARPMTPSLNSNDGSIAQMLGQMGLAATNTAGQQGGQLRQVTGTADSMKVSHNGKLSTLLNQMGSHFGVSWEYANGQIHVFRFVTRTYTVQALPNTIDVKSKLEAGNSSAAGEDASGGDSNESTQSASSDVSVKIWEDLTRAVENVVGDNGRVTTSIGTGTITVTAPADVVRRVQTYIDGQNARLAKPVAVSVKVLNLTLNDSDDLNLDVTALFSGSARYGFNIGNVSGFPAQNPAIGVPGLNFGIISPTSSWRGSNAVAQALAEKGRVSVVTTASLSTLNGIPAPLQVSNTKAYLKQVEAEATESGVSTSLTPGSVTTGFNLSVLPRVSDDRASMMLQFAMNISELVGSQNGFEVFSVGEGANRLTIQLPDKNSRSFVQQAMVPNGATLVLTGFEQVRDTATKRGMGSPEFMLFGGGQSGRQQRDMIVVLLTPVLLDLKGPLITTN